MFTGQHAEPVFGVSSEVHHEAGLSWAPVPPFVVHCSSRSQGIQRCITVSYCGMSLGIQPIDDRQGLCQDS